MGGRSRPRQHYIGRWEFIGKLSDERLENYGKYTREYMLSLGGMGGIYNKESFNHELSKEYERRHGELPPWNTTKQDAIEHSQKHGIIQSKKDKEISNEQTRRSK